jgi:hypothetical protein
MQHAPRLLAAASLAAFLALAACGEQTITADGPPDSQAADLAKAAPVELPPAITASRTYRCKDNSLVYADFYTNNTVNVRQGDRDAPVTVLTAAEGKPPYVAEGFSIDANAATVNFTAPGKGTQSCKA